MVGFFRKTFINPFLAEKEQDCCDESFSEESNHFAETDFWLDSSWESSSVTFKPVRKNEKRAKKLSQTNDKFDFLEVFGTKIATNVHCSFLFQKPQENQTCHCFLKVLLRASHFFWQL